MFCDAIDCTVYNVVLKNNVWASEWALISYCISVLARSGGLVARRSGRTGQRACSCSETCGQRPETDDGHRRRRSAESVVRGLATASGWPSWMWCRRRHQFPPWTDCCPVFGIRTTSMLLTTAHYADTVSQMHGRGHFDRERMGTVLYGC